MTESIEVLITLPFNESQVNRLRSVSPRMKINMIRARKPEDVPAEAWANAEVLYTNQVLPATEQAPKLRWIQFHWAGIDHSIDAPILSVPGVSVTTLSGAAASQVAEYVLMMLLVLGHRLADLLATQKRGEWPKDRLERFISRELRDSIVGIVGYGSIGRQVALLLQPFGAQVLAVKRDVMRPEDTGYTPAGWGDPSGDLLHRLYPPEALRSMFKECDFVVVATPLTAQTRNMINADALASLKPTAFLIDVSRGGIVDHTALAAALRDRKIAGAALDVYPEEPLPAESPLWKLPNVVLTPHISGATPNYDERAIDLFAENLRRYLTGAPLLNRFISERGY